MKRFALIVCCVLFSAVSFAQVTTVYTLDGNYLVQTSRSHSPSWYVTSECIDKGGIAHYATGGGAESSIDSLYGVATFKGTGVTFKGTLDGTFDQAKSNATVKIKWSTDGTCTVLSVNNGYAVYDPPVQGLLSGTYSLTTVTASGIGTGVVTMAVGAKIADFFDFQATGAYVQCFVPSSSKEFVVLSTIMLYGRVTTQPNKITLSGTAQHTNDYVNPCLVASAANSGF
jgi:hypothetical protein